MFDTNKQALKLRMVCAHCRRRDSIFRLAFACNIQKWKKHYSFKLLTVTCDLLTISTTISPAHMHYESLAKPTCTKWSSILIGNKNNLWYTAKQLQRIPAAHELLPISQPSSPKISITSWEAVGETPSDCVFELTGPCSWSPLKLK